MGEWISGDESFTLVTIGTSQTAIELWQNDDAPIHDRTIVDGFVTMLTDTDELWRLDLYAPAPNFAVASDFTFSAPARRDPLNWYRFYVGRGPLVMRTKSKRTFGANQELWMLASKLKGAGVTSELMVGWQFFVSP